MGKKIKMQVDEHRNAGALVNHQRRQVGKVLRDSVGTVDAQAGKSWGWDGDKMGARD